MDTPIEKRLYFQKIDLPSSAFQTAHLENRPDAFLYSTPRNRDGRLEYWR